MTISTEFPQTLLTAEETAKALNISPRHLYTLTKRGQIAAVRIGKLVRYHRDTIAQFGRGAVA